MNEIHGVYFDTINIIKADCDQSVLEGALSQCAMFHALLNRFTPGGDIWAINHAGGHAIAVDAHTVAVLKMGLSICERSGGAFNLCVGPLTALWDFKAAQPALPDPGALERAKARSDWRKVDVNGLRVSIPEGYDLDVGGIAKGYIADQIALFLRDRGVKHALINLGGNIVAIGDRPDGTPWTIGLQSPGGEIGKNCWGTVDIRDESLVTSASYARGFDMSGLRYHHILDPRTGYPVKSSLEAVTLRGSSSVLADGVSTACFVLGPQTGADLAASYHLEGIFLLNDGRALYTPGMHAQLSNEWE